MFDQSNAENMLFNRLCIDSSLAICFGGDDTNSATNSTENTATLDQYVKVMQENFLPELIKAHNAELSSDLKEFIYRLKHDLDCEVGCIGTANVLEENVWGFYDKLTQNKLP